MSQDHYETLEVSPRASLEVIEAAYRVLAKRHHPDRAEAAGRAEAEERMRCLNEARDTLRDPISRREYDRGRRVTSSRQHRPGPPEAPYTAPSRDPATASAEPSRPRRDPEVPDPVSAEPSWKASPLEQPTVPKPGICRAARATFNFAFTLVWYAWLALKVMMAIYVVWLVVWGIA